MDEISKPIGAPSDWSDMSDWEKLCLLPTKVQEYYLLQLIDEGVDFEHLPMELIMRPKQLALIRSDEWITLFSAGRGSGKLTSLNTAIATPNGWTTMGKIAVGDIVFDEKGNICKVIGTYDAEPDRAYRLTFSDNTHVDCGGEHQWVTWTHRSRKQYVRHTNSRKFDDNWAACDHPVYAQVRDTDEIIKTFVYGYRDDLNHCIPLAKPLNIPESKLPFDPWLWGYFCGNGSYSCGSLTTGSKDGDFDHEHILNRVLNLGYEVSEKLYPEKGQGTIRIKDFNSMRKLVGLYGKKIIPTEYLRGSIRQRLELLRGLCDSDGYADPKSRVEFCSTDIEFAKCVLELARSLGEKPVFSEGRATLYGKDCGPKYRVLWNPIHFNPFSLPRKANLISLKTRSQGLKLRHRMITSYEEIPIEPMRCIEVDSPNSMYLIGEGMIPTHNTRTGSSWVIERAKDNPGCIIHLVGRTAADVRDVIVKGDSGILNSSPPDFVPIYVPSNRSLLWPNGSSALAFSSEKADQLRGPQSHFTWCDELASYSIVADASGSTTWDQVVLSTRLGNRPQILATTTPRRTPIIKELLKQAERTIETGVALVTGATLDNRANLSEEYIKAIYNRYAGTHLEKQELHGELSGDAEGAMWKTEDFHFAGIPDDADILTVIGVDPSVGNGGGDDCGILVVSAENLGWQDVNRRKAWIREDLTAQMGPDEWTQLLVETHRRYPNSIICIEGNQGRELLRFAIHQIDPSIPIALVTSKVSKAQRAEPVVLAFRQRRVFLVDSFVELIDECTSWIPNQSKWSPGRIDAMSVALGTLLVDPRPLYPYLPATSYKPRDDELTLDVVPSWRQYHSTHSGLALPPWRR